MAPDWCHVVLQPSPGVVLIGPAGASAPWPPPLPPLPQSPLGANALMPMPGARLAMTVAIAARLMKRRRGFSSPEVEGCWVFVVLLRAAPLQGGATSLDASESGRVRKARFSGR